MAGCTKLVFIGIGQNRIFLTSKWIGFKMRSVLKDITGNCSVIIVYIEITKAQALSDKLTCNHKA